MANGDGNSRSGWGRCKDCGDWIKGQVMMQLILRQMETDLTMWMLDQLHGEATDKGCEEIAGRMIRHMEVLFKVTDIGTITGVSMPAGADVEKARETLRSMIGRRGEE